VLDYAAQAKIAIDCFGAHSLRATGATNAREHDADYIAKVQEWLGQRTSRPHGSTTGARVAREIHQPSRLYMKVS
jgi:integrase